MKLRVLTVGLATLAMLFVAQPAAFSAPSGACASASVTITNSTDTVAPGDTIGILGTGTNCSNSKQRYTVSFYAVSDCLQKDDIATSKIAFRPGQTYRFPVSYVLPYSTCPGPWVVTIEMSSQRGVLATGTTTITVQ